MPAPKGMSPSTSVWTTPGLGDYVQDLKRNGVSARDIASAASSAFGLDLSQSQVYNYLKRTQAAAHSGGPPRPPLDRTPEEIAKLVRESKAEPPMEQPIGRYPSDPRNLVPFRNKPPQNPFTTAVFDIECTGLDASFGRVLCAVIQRYDNSGPNKDGLHIFRADNYPAWKEGRRSDDSGVVADIIACLEDCDILIAHNGVGYDMSFLRTRALIHGMPPFHEKKIFDPLKLIGKPGNKMRFHRNSLDSVASVLDTNYQKTTVNPSYWSRAYGDGDVEAMDYIVDHCIKDVFVLEEVAIKLRSHVGQLDKLGSWR